MAALDAGRPVPREAPGANGRTRERCAWCHERSGRLKRVPVVAWDRFALHRREETPAVPPAHEKEVRAFAARALRHTRLFLGLLFGRMLLGLAPTALQLFA